MSFNTMRDKLHLAGEGVTITKTSTGVFTLLPAVAYDRLITFYVVVTESFAAGDGAATAAKIGQTNDDDKFADDFALMLGFSGDDAVFAPYAAAASLNTGIGILSANQALILTATAATGTGTGGAAVAAVAIAALAA